MDEINSQSAIDYSQIQIGRSECFKISKDAELLHDKFCVIDFKKVITGSYNWTYKASHNSENILILDDPSIATQYISRFEQQKAKFQDSTSQQRSIISVSSNIVNISTQTTTIHKNVVSQDSPKTKLCPNCRKEIGYNDGYCQNCGKHQNGITNKSTTIVICKKCHHKQEEALIDAMNTKYCTTCGSDRLEWMRK